MDKCKVCGKEISFVNSNDGLCLVCDAKQSVRTGQTYSTRPSSSPPNIEVTTEATLPNVSERLGVVSAEVVLGMNVLKDIMANVRDLLGGRSKAVQETLGEARELALDDLKSAAADRGANAIVAVSLDYHSISTGSAVNMMIVAVNGTAVKLS